MEQTPLMLSIAAMTAMPLTAAMAIYTHTEDGIDVFSVPQSAGLV
jgi:hypothetical protein